MSAEVKYADIPRAARDTLDEIYDAKGVEIWWNHPNRLLGHYTTGLPYRGNLIPRDHAAAAADLAEALADGVFF